MQPVPYRSTSLPTPLVSLVDRGRAVRQRMGHDPHAMRAPGTISDPRATALERIAVGVEEAGESMGGEVGGYYARRWFVGALGQFIGLGVVGLLMVASFALMFLGRWFFPAFGAFVLAGIGVVALAVHRKNQPRRWLSRHWLRADGYLELLGREHRVVRLRALIRFQNGATPELDLFKDALTGAGVISQGVLVAQPGVVAVHSPDIDGNRRKLHLWFQTLCDLALTPVNDGFAIASVVLEER